MRALKLILFLVLLAGAAFVGFAFFGDLTPEEREITVPVAVPGAAPGAAPAAAPAGGGG
jgi:hypothetical protein